MSQLLYVISSYSLLKGSPLVFFETFSLEDVELAFNSEDNPICWTGGFAKMRKTFTLGKETYFLASEFLDNSANFCN